MTEQQTSKLAATLVERQNEFRQLTNDEAQWVIQHPVEAIAIMVTTIKSAHVANIRPLENKESSPTPSRQEEPELHDVFDFCRSFGFPL